MDKVVINRSARLKEVYEHLRNHFGIHTQGGFADSIGYSRPVISSALNGNSENVTDKMLRMVVRSYPGVFNLDYLMNGTGQLLTTEEGVSKADTSERLGHADQPAQQPVQVEIPEALQLLIDKTLAVSRHNDELVDRLAHAISDNKEVQIALRSMSDTLHQDASESMRLRCELTTAVESIHSFRSAVDTIRKENETLRLSNQMLSKRLDKAAELFARLNTQVENLVKSRDQYPPYVDHTPSVSEPVPEPTK